MIGDLPGLFTLRTVTVPSVRTTTFIQNVVQTTQVTVPSFTVVNQPQVIQIPPTAGQVIPPFTIQVPTLVPTTVQVPVTTTTPLRVRRQETVLVPVDVRVPVPAFSGFKIAENEGPGPEDRVFFTYNFYSDVNGGGGRNVPRTDTVTTSIGGNPATITTVVPAVPPLAIDVHREVAGFEKTFLDGNASLGLRVPVVEEEGGFGPDGLGGMTGILKVALFQDPDAGTLLSGGLAVTAPTGHSIPTLGGNLRPVILQPFVGYLFGGDRFYLQGFTSVAVPTDSRDVTLLFNDVGIGYAVYRGPASQAVSAIVPTVEAHVTTPLNNRDAGALVTVPDLVVLTGGAHLGLYDRGTLTLGVATPVTGPRVFDVEAVVQFNWRF
jgi:hypothetical protein